MSCLPISSSYAPDIKIFFVRYVVRCGTAVRRKEVHYEKVFFKVSPIIIVIIGIVMLVVPAQTKQSIQGSITIIGDSARVSEMFAENDWKILERQDLDSVSQNALYEKYTATKTLPPVIPIWVGIMVVIMGTVWGAWEYWILPGAKKAGGTY
ncbi:hypothetical protein HC823_00140 [Candidatus Gracilibacteria bacterium]|nr:hypothetical protein [Candidatus Gracilibacteria bacterium]